MMSKLLWVLSAVALSLTAVASANARSIVYDEESWVFSPTISSGTTMLTPGFGPTLTIGSNTGSFSSVADFEFSVSPGAGENFAEAYDLGYVPNSALLIDTSDGVNAYKFNWGSDPTQNASSTPPLNGISEQVIVYQSIAAPSYFEVDFNFPVSTSSCASSTPTTLAFYDSYVVRGPGIPLYSFSSNNPCASDSDFVFGGSGIPQIPGGWNDTTTGSSAPEIDPASGTSAITLLLGGIAVIKGLRRRA